MQSRFGRATAATAVAVVASGALGTFAMRGWGRVPWSTPSVPWYHSFPFYLFLDVQVSRWLLPAGAVAAGAAEPSPAPAEASPAGTTSEAESAATTSEAESAGTTEDEGTGASATDDEAVATTDEGAGETVVVDAAEPAEEKAEA